MVDGSERWNAAELTRRAAIAAPVLRVLANPVRLRASYLLLDGERSVGDLANSLGVSYPAMSQHLRRMHAVQAVTSRREGNSIYYSLLENHIARLTLEALWYSGHVDADDRGGSADDVT